MKFLTDEWFDQLTENIYAIFNRPNKLTFLFCEVFENCPFEDPTVWVIYEVERGIAKNVTHGVGTLPDADYYAKGDYKDHVKICKKQLDPKKAVISGLFRVEDKQGTGKLKLLSLIGMYMKLVEAKQIDGVEY